MQKTISCRRLLTAFAVGAALSSTVAFSQTAMFSVKELANLPGGTQAGASSINNAGNVLGGVSGSSQCPTGCAVIWVNGTPTLLDPVAGATSPSVFSINNANQVAGSAQVNGLSRAVTWINGKPTILDGPSSDALAINDAGQLVGNGSVGTDAIGPATEWNGLTPTTLDLLPGCAYSTATGINSGGLIVGYMTGGCNEAVVWHGTTPTALPKFSVPKAGAEALAVNNSGIVVGKASSPTSGKYEHAVAWANGVITDLGALDAKSFATAINNRGVIVGQSDTNSASANHAVLWSRIGAPIQDLNDLISATAASEVFLMSAVAINDNCTVVAQGINRKSKQFEALILILNDPSKCVNGL